jgi:hypothetical protein
MVAFVEYYVHVVDTRGVITAVPAHESADTSSPSISDDQTTQSGHQAEYDGDRNVLS